MALQRAKFRGEDSPDRFREVLHRLKRDGCNLLVTGEVSQSVTARATRTLLGAANVDRKRVLTLADGDQSVHDRLPKGVAPDASSVWVIGQQADHRAVPSPVDEPADGDEPTPDEYRTHLAGLREEILSAIEYFEKDGLDPAELRLSVDSLDYLGHDHDEASLAEFVRSVSEEVRDVRGMAHYHLRHPDDSELVERLTPVVEARIELRKREGLPAEQRWHVPEYGQATEWVQL
ncbi:DUF7504 family protein [Halorussus halophilus]|uniref:DUF7504 family protein n=1 Tax=Halorussus halophilus TaxID=2650975 RepID=UPI00130132E7|nr:hypothetical protein [Halorussus halophilus]